MVRIVDVRRFTAPLREVSPGVFEVGLRSEPIPEPRDAPCFGRCSGCPLCGVPVDADGRKNGTTTRLPRGGDPFSVEPGAHVDATVSMPRSALCEAYESRERWELRLYEREAMRAGAERRVVLERQAADRASRTAEAHLVVARLELARRTRDVAAARRALARAHRRVLALLGAR